MDDPNGRENAPSLAAFVVENPEATVRFLGAEFYRRTMLGASAVGSFALFLWCAVTPDPWRFGAALAFTLLVHVPTWLAERKRR